MSKGYPSKAEAEKIWEQGIAFRRAGPYPFEQEDEYRFHSRGVGEAAEKIAKYIPGMDSEKAFVFGLLHDYGKRKSQSAEGIFHGKEGYDAMMALGYPEVAQICLTHSYITAKEEKDFDAKYYLFPKEWIQWSKEKLQDVEYTDYDLLIGLCDKFFESLDMVSIEKRVDGIIARYGLDNDTKSFLLEMSFGLKRRIETLTGTDVYKILGIED